MFILNKLFYCLLFIVLVMMVSCASHKSMKESDKSSISHLYGHAGTVVSISNDMIVINYDGKDHNFKITSNTKLHIPLEILKTGDNASVLTKIDDQTTALDVKSGLIEIPINIKIDDSEKLRRMILEEGN